MTLYTEFNPDGDPEYENVAILSPSKKEALMNLIHGWYIIRGDWLRGDSSREGQAKAVRFIKRVISGELGGKPYELHGVEWRLPKTNWDDYEDDDLEEGVRKMSFNDIVKKQIAKNHGITEQTSYNSL